MPDTAFYSYFLVLCIIKCSDEGLTLDTSAKIALHPHERAVDISNLKE